MLQTGQPAPAFSLPDQDGTMHSLGQYLGQWVLVYFYPQDDTSGCTAEACGIRDNLPKFKEMSAVVLGISGDTVDSHKQFAQKYGLPFTLLADPEKQVIEAYGAKSENGTARRVSYLINPEGVIAKAYDNVIPEKHAEEVLEDLTSV